MDGWVRVVCEVADVIRHSEHVTPYGGRSDLGGQYGDPSVYTEWGLKNSTEEVLVMREYRWPAPDFDGPDTRPCEHWVPVPTGQQAVTEERAKDMILIAEQRGAEKALEVLSADFSVVLLTEAPPRLLFAPRESSYVDLMEFRLAWDRRMGRR